MVADEFWELKSIHGVLKCSEEMEGEGAFPRSKSSGRIQPVLFGLGEPVVAALGGSTHPPGCNA